MWAYANSLLIFYNWCQMENVNNQEVFQQELCIWMQSLSLCVVNPQIDWKPDVKPNVNASSNLWCTSPPTDHHFISPKSLFRVAEEYGLCCWFQFQKPLVLKKKNMSSLLNLIGKCYSVWAALTGITSLTLCHLSLQIESTLLGTVSFRSGVFCEHSFRPDLWG